MRKLTVIAIIGILFLSISFNNSKFISKTTLDSTDYFISENNLINSLNSSNSQLNQRIERILYNTTINWTNQYIKINESTSFDWLTSITINNCIIEFYPVNSTHFIDFFIDSGSKLVIQDSIIFQNYSAEGHSSIYFRGGYLEIENSTFQNLGINHDFPGLHITNTWYFEVTGSTFIDCHRGMFIEESEDIIITNCTFKDLFRVNAIGILGYDLIRTNITYCNFDNIVDTGSGIVVHDAINLSIANCNFTNYGLVGIEVQTSDWAAIVENVTIEQSAFQNGTFGCYLRGIHVLVKNNEFWNMSYAGLSFLGYNATAINNTFDTMVRGVVYPAVIWFLSAISDTTIQNNSFNNISDHAIFLNNYDGPTTFSYLDNKITNVGAAFGFVGNVGGESETNRARISGNFIENVSNFAITGISWDYLARFKHICFSRNAFINCSLGYTSFQEDYYYLIDIQWDDGFFGNYWDEFVIENDTQDEDSNSINDDFYVVNVQFGQVDLSPLLSTDLVHNPNIGSTHPFDFTRTQEELTENNTLTWITHAIGAVQFQVWANNESYEFEVELDNVTFSLLLLKHGYYNLTLAILSDNVTYRDTVWVTILPPSTNFIVDILIPLGTAGFLIAIVAVFIVRYTKKK